jgi:hypothetical protein
MGKMALSHGIPGLDRRRTKDICHHSALQTLTDSIRKKW